MVRKPKQNHKAYMKLQFPHKIQERMTRYLTMDEQEVEDRITNKPFSKTAATDLEWVKIELDEKLIPALERAPLL